MGIFSRSKSKEELMLVFHIGSSSIEGALFFSQSSGIPKIIFSAKEYIQLEEKIDINKFLPLMNKALETVSEKIFKAGLGAPKKIYCVLSSPWYVSQIRVINFAQDTNFTFTEKFADSLIQKEIKIFEEENSAKYGDVGNFVRPIELKNINTTLNGYVTSTPLNQKAKKLEMTVLVSISGEKILKSIEDIISKHFHFNQIKFSSFLVASFTALRDMHLQQENFLLVDVGGEITDISMIKKNSLRESISFPLGHNFLTRELATRTGSSFSEADSLMSLFRDGHAEESVNKKLGEAIKELRLEWLRKFQDSLANISNDISIPSTIYLIVDKDLSEFFSDTIKNEQFSQYTLAESKFEVTLLDTKLLHGVATFEENVIRDSFLIIDSIYINRFLAKI